MAKFTMSSLRSFVKKNKNTLMCSTSTYFDGMYDCVMPVDKVSKVKAVVGDVKSPDLGLRCVWITKSTPNYLYPKYNESGVVESVDVNNCCGSFTLYAK